MFVVTGGCGFIGSNVIAGLENEFDEEIVIIDDTVKWKNIYKRKKISYIIKSCDALSFLDNHKDKISAVIHMAELYDNENIDALLDVNFNFGRKLWDFCSDKQIPFLYGSSYRTYGHEEEYFMDAFSEEALAALRPNTPYAWSKNLFDISISRDVLKNKKTPPQWVGLKLFSVYGPNEYHKQHKRSLVIKSYPLAVKEKSFTLYKSENDKFKDGEQMRDFIYVKDCVDVMIWFLKNNTVSGFFNLGTGAARTFYDLALSVYKTIGVEPKIKYDDIPQELCETYRYYTKANISKLREAGYTKPFTSLEDGVRDYVLNYLHTSDPYR